jgi:hypothetical protein
MSDEDLQAYLLDILRDLETLGEVTPDEFRRLAQVVFLLVLRRGKGGRLP